MNPYAEHPKKMIITNIYKVLKDYSDAENRLSRSDVAKYLKQDYSMDVTDKCISKNLNDMMEYGYDIDCNEFEDKNGRFLRTGWYLKRKFDNSELILLINHVLFSKYITKEQCEQLIKKLKGLSNVYFRNKIKYLPPDNLLENEELFRTFSVLSEAIAFGNKVSFNHNKRIYKVSPYYTVMNNGRHFLICNLINRDDIWHFRIDSIMGIKRLDEPIKPLSEVKGLERGELSEYLSKHIYMFTGEAVPVAFAADKSMRNAIIDWFGKNAVFTKETDDKLFVRVITGENDMQCWGLQYGRYVEVLSPKSLRDKIAETVKQMSEVYGGEET